MTDLVTPPATASAATESVEPPIDGDAPDVAWAPHAEKHPRRRWPLALWIGIPAVALAAAGWYFGTTLIAPGVAIAGVPVGGMTADAAAAKVSQTIADTAVTIDAGGVTAIITGADLGATIAADDLAAAALESHPLWQVGGWFPNPDGSTPVFDADAAEESVSSAFDAIWVPAVDAEVTYDDATDLYVVAPADPGTGVDVAAVEDAYRTQLFDADASGDVEQDLVELDPAITTETATTRAGELNAVLAAAGFYVGDERTVALPADVTASWLTLTPDVEQGTIDISADEDAIEAVVATLPAAVDRAPVNGTVLVNEAGTVLRTETQGADGRTLASTAGIAAAFATQLAAADGAYALDVTVAPATTTNLVRLLEVDLSEQHVYLKENGVVVDHWTVSSGMAGWETHQGHFTVQAKVRVQDMGNEQVGYLQPDVEWVSYFSGDQAFHGVYWRPTRAVPMSHGCVGMPNGRAQFIYNWAPVGTDVWVHP